MSFGIPLFFWATLAILPLVGVYFIRTRPRRQVVNAFFLWQQVFQQKAASSLFQKLRNLLSLLLVALAFLAAVLALTRPRFDDGKTPDLLVIIDQSASMQTFENGSSRLELAKRLADSWITALGGSQRAAIASVATKLDYHANLTTHPGVLRDALAAIQPTDLSLDPHALAELTFLSSATDGTSGKTRILLLTDRQSAELKLPAGIEIVQIGGLSKNIGITAADLRWDGPGQATLFVSLVSSFPGERAVEMELVSATDASLARLFTVKIPAQAQVSESIPINAVSPGAWLLRVRGEDSLSIDDTAPLGLNPPQAIPVQVKAVNPFFFNQCISAFSRADSLFEPVDAFARLALAEGAPPECEAAVVFSPSGNSPFWSDLGSELEPGPPELVAKNHPLLTRLDPALLNFDGARKLIAPQGSVIVLAHTDGTPLLYTITIDGRAAVVFNFDPARADFFLSPWFPVFVHEAAVFLTGRENNFPSAVATGTRVDVPGTGETGRASFRAGKSASDLPKVMPASVNRVGSYYFSRSSTDWHLGGAVLSVGESGSAPHAGHAPDLKIASGWPLAAWFLLAAIIAVLAEELLYHRRKVG